MKRIVVLTILGAIVSASIIILVYFLTAPLTEEQFSRIYDGIIEGIRIEDYSFAESKITEVVQTQNLHQRHLRKLIRLSYMIFKDSKNLKAYEVNTLLLSSRIEDQGFADIFYLDALLKQNKYYEAIKLTESKINQELFPEVIAYISMYAKNHDVDTSLNIPDKYNAFSKTNSIEELQELGQQIGNNGLLHNAAVKMYQQNYVDQAIKQLEYLHSEDSLLFLARLLLDKNFYYRSQNTLDRLPAHASTSIDALLLYADIALETGDYNNLNALEDNIQMFNLKPKEESILNQFYVALLTGNRDSIKSLANQLLDLDSLEAYKAILRAIKIHSDLWDLEEIWLQAKKFNDPGINLLYLELTKHDEYALLPRLWNHFWEYPDDPEVPRYLSYLLFSSQDRNQLRTMIERVRESHGQSKWFEYFDIYLYQDEIQKDYFTDMDTSSYPWYTDNLLAQIAIKHGFYDTALRLLTDAIDEPSRAKTHEIRVLLRFNKALVLTHTNSPNIDEIMDLLHGAEFINTLRPRAELIRHLLESRQR